MDKNQSINKNKEKFNTRPGRLIIIDGVKWKWKVGRIGGVTAYSENGERIYSPACFITGGDFHRGQYKKSSEGSVCPSDIELWIKYGVILSPNEPIKFGDFVLFTRGTWVEILFKPATSLAKDFVQARRKNYP